jgi:hypothetical protein
MLLLHLEMRRVLSLRRSMRRFAAPPAVTNFGFPLDSLVWNPGDDGALATRAREDNPR